MPATTPNLGLALPVDGTTNWGPAERNNLTLVDTAFGTLQAEVAAVATPVASVFTRTGAVTAHAGDYTFAQIGGTVDPSQLPAVPLSSLVGVVPIANGGTGAADAIDGRSNLFAAVKGVNDDITQLTGLTTPLSITQGGTGATTAVAALAALYGGLYVVAFSATPVFDGTLGGSFKITLTGNVTSSTATNMAGKLTVPIRIVQDATGGRTFVWPANVRGGGAVNPGANARSVQLFSVDADGSLDAIGPMMYS